MQPEHVEQVQIKTFGSDATTIQTVEVVWIGIELRTEDTINVLFFCGAVDPWTLVSQPIAYNKAKYTGNHLEGLDLVDHSRVDDELQIDALIGSDHYWQIASSEVIQRENSPTAILTYLVWVLSGPISGFTTQGNSVNLRVTHSLHIGSAEDRLDHSLKAFWDLESLGITTTKPSVYDNFTDGIRFDNGYYMVSLSWKPNQITRLPSTFVLPNSDLKDSSKGFVISQKWGRSIMQLCKNSWGKASLRRWLMSHQSVLLVKSYIIYRIMPSSIKTRQLRSCKLFMMPWQGQMGHPPMTVYSSLTKTY